MAIITVSSLKGGVGKTSASVNVSHALARRGCEVLLIDLDPSAHTTRYFKTSRPEDNNPLVPRMFRDLIKSSVSVDEVEQRLNQELIEGNIRVRQVRDCLALLPGGREFRAFTGAKARKIFAEGFRYLIEELSASFDYVVIDTPPEYSILTETAVRASDLVVMPVDCSAMGVAGLEELVLEMQDVKGPRLAILRTMVNRQASRIRKLSEQSLSSKFSLRQEKDKNIDSDEAVDIINSDDFISFVTSKRYSDEVDGDNQGFQNGQSKAEDPVFLLNSVIYRTEQQNRLSFLRKTAFDSSPGSPLSLQYAALARELEFLLSLTDEVDETENDNFLAMAMQGSAGCFN